MRGHVFKFLHQILAAHPDLREALARCPSLPAAHALVDALAMRYALPGPGAPADVLRAAADDTACQGGFAQAPAAVGPRSWYRRHR